jgi:hypothetical protein
VGTQPLGQGILLGVEGERLQLMPVTLSTEKLLADLDQHLLAGPRLVLIGEGEDLIHEAGLLPPDGEVLQQRRLAGATHPADEQHSASAQQTTLDLQDI